MTENAAAKDLADRRARALAIASRISSTVLAARPAGGQSTGTGGGSWPVSDGSGHGSGGDRFRKIFLPTDNEINYFGLLIGPKGQTLKDMQNESGARISIKGRGSTKDGNDENPDEALHVVIEAGTEAQAARAERLVNDLLFNRSTQASVKEEQLRAVAANKQVLVLNDRLYGSDISYPPFRGSGEKSKIINVAATQVGQIIGRGGDTIKMLQTKTGAFIQVSREADPASNMKTVTIEGSAAQIEHAEDEIMRLLHESEQRDMHRRGGGDDGGSASNSIPLGGGSGLGYGGDSQAVVVRIPHDAVGLLIGKAGLTIKQMQLRTGCNIQVQRDIDADPSCHTRDVTLIGTEAQREEAKREVLNLIQGQSDVPVEPMAGLSVMVMHVPGHAVGGIIGRQGENIKSIQYRTGCRVQVSRDVTQPERELVLSGTDQAVAMAKAEIENLVADGDGRGPDRRRSNDQYDSSRSYANDPYSRQAATYGADQYYGMAAQPGYYPGAQQAAYPMAAYGAAAAYGQPGYGAYADPSGMVAAGAQPQPEAGSGENATADPAAAGAATDDANLTPEQYAERWNTYCMQYYAYYGQYPPEAYAQQPAAADGSAVEHQPENSGVEAAPVENVAPPAPANDDDGDMDMGVDSPKVRAASPVRQPSPPRARTPSPPRARQPSPPREQQSSPPARQPSPPREKSPLRPSRDASPSANADTEPVTRRKRAASPVPATSSPPRSTRQKRDTSPAAPVEQEADEPVAEESSTRSTRATRAPKKAEPVKKATTARRSTRKSRGAAEDDDVVE